MQSINPISPRVARSYSYTPAATRQLSLSMSNADPSESMDYYPSRNFTSTPGDKCLFIFIETCKYFVLTDSLRRDLLDT